jgi:hypothetical protein
MPDTTPPAPVADDAADRFALIELDLDVAPAVAPVARTVAPVVTQAPPVAASPLVQGRALLTKAPTVEALLQAAHTATAVCVAAGITDKAHPTREALRALYFATVAWFCLRRNLAALADAIAERPSLVRPTVAPVAAPVAAPSGHDLAGALGAISAEGASNAAGSGAGSMAGGQLAYAGFTSAAGYVTALANGVKAGTAESYRATLRSRFGYTPEQLAALQVTIIAESALPVGAGITHAPTSGVSVADMTREQARAHFAALNPAAKAQAAVKAQEERASTGRLRGPGRRRTWGQRTGKPSPHLSDFFLQPPRTHPMSKRVNIRAILASPLQRRELMVTTIIATQAREGVVTTRTQAEAAYDRVRSEVTP